MGRATVRLDPAFTVGPVRPRIFGSFVEHMGRCVYTGIYEPGHPTADDRRLPRATCRAGPRARGHARALPRRQLRLRLPLGGRRRPGRATGPRRLDLAWRSDRDQRRSASTSSSTGRGERRRRADDGGQPRHPRRAGGPATCCEYTNHPDAARPGPTCARQHGAREPHGIRVWCLGNEMDGPWQIGPQDRRRVRPARRGDRPGDAADRPGARARRLRQLQPRDADLRRVGGRRCSSTPTTRRLHLRARLLRAASTATWPASSPPRSTWTTSSIAWSPPPTTSGAKRLQAQADQDLLRRVERLVPERVPTARPGPRDWPRGPARSSRTCYTVADAVVVGSLLITLLRHTDRVTIACQAQLVNVIAPIRTEPGGPAWRQTIFHPFALTARLARGTVLRASRRLRPGGDQGLRARRPARRHARPTTPTPATSPSSWSTAAAPRRPS